jgi:multiple sugar transport system substrate-binding protein
MALKVAAAAGSAPDIGMSGSWQMQELAAAAILRPHDEYLKASRVVKQADLWPTHVRDMTYKGKQYGMPFGPDVRVMYLHTDTLASVGLNSAKPAQTWDELDEHIKRIYREENGKPARVGFAPFWGSGLLALWLVPFWQSGGETLSADNQTVTINNERGIQALEWLKHVYDIQGGWDALGVLQKLSTAPQHFVNGRMGYYFDAFSTRKTPDFVNAPNLRFGFAPWPLPKGGRRANYGGCHAFGITTQSKSPDAAWRFLELLADEPNNLRFAVRYDRIPIRIKTAESAAYHHDDPFNKLAVEEMRYRRILIAAPGGTELLDLTQSLASDAVSGKKAVRQVLGDAQTQMQQVLDKWKR